MGSVIKLEEVGLRMSPQDAQFQKTSVADLLGARRVDFPGAQPVSFARRHLQELTQEDYFLCEKTDGLRCLLYLTQFVEGENSQEAQFLIDRRNDYYLVPRDAIHIPPLARDFDADKGQSGARPIYNIEGHHCGTLLDGELVLQRFDGRQQLTYLVFDCLALDGECIMNRAYDKRIGKAEQFVYRPWEAFAKDYADDASHQPFQLQLKKWQLPYGAEMMFRQVIPNLPHGNDGLIFTCKESPYVTGTDQHILKWKPPHENTVDFRLQLGLFPPLSPSSSSTDEDFDAKPHIDLLVYHGKDHGKDDYRPYATLALTDAEWKAMKRLQQMLDWRIIECYRDSTTGQWRPKLELDGSPRFRDDKTHANHVSVVHSVIESIEDAVSEQDLIAASPRIREQYKLRQKEAADRRKNAQDAAAPRRPGAASGPAPAPGPR